MLNKNSLNFLGLYINFGHLLGFHPYSFSKVDGLLHFESSDHASHRRFWACIILGILNSIFLVVRTIQKLWTEDMTLFQQTNLAYLAGVYMVLNSNQWITIKSYGHHGNLINSFLTTSATLTEKLGGTSKLNSGEGQISGKLKGLAFTAFFISVARALGAILKPQSPELFTSLAANPRGLPFWIKFLAGLVHVHLSGFQMYFGALYPMVTFCYVSSVLPILRGMRIVENDRDKEDSKLSADTLRQCWTQLSVLQRHFTAVFGLCPIMAELCFISSGIIHLALAVISHSLRSLVTSVCCILGILLLFDRFAAVHTDSMVTLNSWKFSFDTHHSPLCAWFPKFRVACDPIKINVGSFFFVDKRLVLTIISIVIDNSTTLILSSKNSSATN